MCTLSLSHTHIHTYIHTHTHKHSQLSLQNVDEALTLYDGVSLTRASASASASASAATHLVHDPLAPAHSFDPRKTVTLPAPSKGCFVGPPFSVLFGFIAVPTQY